MVRHVLNLTFGPAAGNVCHTAAAPTIDPNSSLQTRAHTCTRAENKATNQYLTPAIFLNIWKRSEIPEISDLCSPSVCFVKSSFAAVRGA